MLQTLFHIPAEIHGVPVFGVGLLLAMWAVFSVGLLAWLARKQGWNADTLGYLPLLAIVAAVIVWVLPVLCETQNGAAKGLPIRGYGVLVLSAVLSGLGLLAWRARRAGVDSEMVLTLAFWMILPGIAGARVFYVMQYWERDFLPVYLEKGSAAMLLAVVNLAAGGLVVYGAFLGGMAGLLAFWWKYRIPILGTADLFAPSLMLGLALGRVGCMMNGCCFGGACELPWAVTFPAESPPYHDQVQRGETERLPFYGVALSDVPTAAPVIEHVVPHSVADHAGLQAGDRLKGINGRPTPTAAHARDLLADAFARHSAAALELDDGRVPTLAARSLPVHPTQLYAATTAALLCLLLLAVDPFLRREGALFALLLTLYPIARFLEESIRTDEKAIWGTGLHISQNISLALLACAVALWFYVLRQPVGRRFCPFH